MLNVVLRTRDGLRELAKAHPGAAAAIMALSDRFVSSICLNLRGCFCTDLAGKVCLTLIQRQVVHIASLHSLF